MNFLEMYKELTDEERQEFIRLIIQEINNYQKKLGEIILINKKEE